MRQIHNYRAALLVAVIAAAFCVVAVDFAEARRGGGFGSRGLRTFQKPAPTQTAPRNAQPINRSMTPSQQPSAQSRAATRTAQQQNRGMFGGMMGGLMGGLLLGGLIGMLLGHGIGGLAGFLGLILQVGLVILVVSLVMRYFRNRSPQAAVAGNSPRPASSFDFSAAGQGSGEPMRETAADAMASSDVMGEQGDEIGITAEDLDQFEQLLSEIQAAFTREDYAGLRERCTPEIVSYLSEELSQNAVNGRRNEVLDVSLLQGDLAEAWAEGDTEYATVAMRYQSIDVMRDRQSGEIVEGAEHPTETTEIWTFVRPTGGSSQSWKLSAIQDS